MMMSALLATSAVIVAPLAANEVVGVVGAVASGAGVVAAGTAPAIGALPRERAGVAGGGDAVDAPASVPLSIARSVCATRAASAFLRETMNMLPAGEPCYEGVSVNRRARS